MKFTYKVKAEKIQDDEVNLHIVYGIEVVNVAGNIVAYIPNVFLDNKKAENFVNLCNSEQLSPIHLMDVIEDFLYEL